LVLSDWAGVTWSTRENQGCFPVQPGKELGKANQAQK